MTSPSLDADLITTNQGWRLRDRAGQLWAMPMLSPQLAEALSRLDGHHHLGRLRAHLAPDEVSVFDSLIAEFSHSGLLEQSVDDDALSELPVVVVVGCSTLGCAAAEALSTLKLTLHLIDPLPADPLLYGTGVGIAGHDVLHRSAAAALRQRLVRAGIDRRRLWNPQSWNHWSELNSASAVDLVVVASDRIEADRAVTTHLSREGIPHLVLGAHREQAVVGPWVRPGWSACLGCIDRHRADQDSLWPTIVSKLSSRRAHSSSDLAGWVAATLRCWVEDDLGQADHPDQGRDHDRSTATVITFRGATGRPQTQHWPPHPRCPCRAVLN